MTFQLKKMTEQQIEEYTKAHLEEGEDYSEMQKNSTFNQLFSGMVENLKHQMEEVISLMQKINHSIQEKEYEKAYDACDKTTALMEDICHKLRGLPYQYGRQNGLEHLRNHLYVAAEIKFEYLPHDILKIGLPDLLPKRIKFDGNRKDGIIQTQNYDYVRASYLEAFNHEFYNGRFHVHDKKVVLFFCHCYLNEFFMRDHDNMDVKIITDIISSFLLYDDNPVCCSHYSDYRIDSYNHTEIFVIPEHEFIPFLQNKPHVALAT